MNRGVLLTTVMTMTAQLNLADEKPPSPADLVVVNAAVHTMNPAQSTAEAIAVTGNRITAVGPPSVGIPVFSIAGKRRSSSLPWCSASAYSRRKRAAFAKVPAGSLA